MIKIKVPVSAGEIIDKVTILEIKISRIKVRAKQEAAAKELNELSDSLNKIFSAVKQNKNKLIKLKKSLKTINLKLWNIENKIRQKEFEKSFGKEFIELARNVYKFNDKRAEMKNRINILTGSALIEVKEYKI